MLLCELFREHNSHKNDLRNIPAKDVVRIFEKHNIRLAHEAAAGMMIPDTEPSHILYQWMSDYFSTAADTVPNGAGIVELPWESKKSFYKEYVSDMKDRSSNPVSIKHFYRTWKSLFHWVKIRKIKAVSGKCWECCNLMGKSGVQQQFRYSE